MIDIHRLKYLLYFIVFLMIAPNVQGQENFPDERDIRKIIRKEQNEKFLSLLERGLANHYKTSDTPLLYLGIRYDNATVIKYLLEFGADPDMYYRDKNMLMWAVRFNRPTALRLLLDYGASVDAQDDRGVTALMMAAWMNRTSDFEILIEYGANIYLEDRSGKNAVELAVYECEESTGFEMDTRIFMRKQIPPRYDYVDGPYVDYLSDSLARVSYFYYDNYDSIVRRIDSLFAADEKSFSFRGFVFDTNTYDLQFPLDIQKSRYERVEKIFAINDVHGHYDSFVDCLTRNNIINSKRNWQFGAGHLVINGDVFDRGGKVTETLWLIYKLEKQARQSGGRVHFLLGNHEIMILDNDDRYKSKKYQFFANHFGWNYAAFFTRNTFLGEWLRKHNSMIVINDNLFVHGGISSVFYKEKLRVEQINKEVRYKLNNYQIANEDPLFSMNGPFWYRGYLWKGKDFEKITRTSLDSILNFYHVNHIIVGHTITDQIQLLFDQKIIALSAPFHENDENIYGLLILNGVYYKVSGDIRKRLF
ncbi:MAG: ankyrin repeat domain-containing protein [Bacteroidales bacterium]|nr:ankyrin repeat domain-containing protein [Bacteroidales bacterium]